MANKEAIREAIRVMQQVKDMALPFNMERWFEKNDPEDCGTAACFAGWLCRDKWFQAKGLGKIRDDLDFFCPAIFARGGLLTNDAAIAELLGITSRQAWDVIYPSRYREQGWTDGVVTPGLVIERLRRLLDD